MIAAHAYNTFPSTIFPIGTVIEDQTAIMKIHSFALCRSGHSYKVEVLKWKIEPPTSLKEQLNEKSMWIFVSADSMANIKTL
jgi:hypothetical protein